MPHAQAFRYPAESTQGLGRKKAVSTLAKMTASAVAPIAPPNLTTLLTPLLPALTAAAASTEPAIGVLPLLSPILRQRVQFLSASSSDPWLRLLCYDSSKASRLAEVATSSALEPHPVSGEAEVDWDYDSNTLYRRVDSETLQALIVLEGLGLVFRLVYCIGDPDGGDGWRVGEVTVTAGSEPLESFNGVPTIEEAERQFEDERARKKTESRTGHAASADINGHAEETGEEDNEDDYWAQYDATPGRTPAQKHSPAPGVSNGHKGRAAQEDDYFAQYDNVQPAMDNHDPDEVVEQAPGAPPLGLGANSIVDNRGQTTEQSDERKDQLLHPRPESSASSNGSQKLVERLEEEAGRQGQSEFGVKQHISRSIRSLFMLSRASGIGKEEFSQLVRTELDVLDIMEDMD